jgi:hypothetical protein
MGSFIASLSRTRARCLFALRFLFLIADGPEASLGSLDKSNGWEVTWRVVNVCLLDTGWRRDAALAAATARPS